MRIYLSGPITSMPCRADAEAAFTAASVRVTVLGHIAVNPMAIMNPLNCDCPVEEPTHTWECCLRKDIPHLTGCDAIYLLAGWECSRGARLELHIALELGLQVFVSAIGIPMADWMREELRKEVAST